MLYSSLCITALLPIFILCNSSVLQFNTFVRPNGSDVVVVASYGVGGKRSVGSCSVEWEFVEESWDVKGGGADTYVCMMLVGWVRKKYSHKFSVLRLCI